MIKSNSYGSNSSNVNNTFASLAPAREENVQNPLMESFLEYARNGNLNSVREIIEQHRLYLNSQSNDNQVATESIFKNFNINYRGIHKRFYGWTALHLSCYFNQPDVVKYLLQQPDIDVNIPNNENDTPLHKAVHSSINSSRYEIVELLLLHHADISPKNNQGLKPIDLASDPSVKKLIQAAEKTENYNLQKQFFEAVLANDLDTVNKLVKFKNFDINCTDTFGNTALHVASNRNQCEIAILLIEKGINTILKNQNQLTALDLAKTKEMKEIIGYVPYNHKRYQGYLLKKRKFLGYKEYFVVLNKGSIIYYSNEVDANHDQNRKGTYILNNAFIKEYDDNGQQDYLAYSWTINYTSGRKHTLCSLIPHRKKNYLDGDEMKSGKYHKTRTIISTKRTQLNPLDRKRKWIEAIKEHIEYSDSHMQAQNNEAQVIMPLESLQKYLNALKIDEDKLNFLLIQIDQQVSSVSPAELNQLSANSNLFQIFSNYRSNFDSLKIQIKNLIDDANKCISLHDQRDAFLKAQLAESRSKCELLEQSLRVIAQENLDLEAKKLRSNVKPSRAASPSKASAKMSTEDEIANDAGLNSSILGEDEDQLEEEFFDIADDPLTDEEILDNDQNRTRPNESIDNESLALRSCYGSLTELNISVTEKLQTKKPVEQILNSNHSQIVPVRQQSNIDVDEQGWSHSNTRKRSKSCTYLDNFRHTQCKSVSNGSYYYNLWQSELFRVRAFERQNEKLEQRVKCLENKLEKETQQQIKISLEWRKTVINLVDENTRIKLLLAALSKEPNS